MSGIKRPTEKHLMVCSGRAFPELAEEVASLLGVSLVPTRALTYANSEIYVRFEESVRGADAFIIQSHTAPINEAIMEHLLMIDAAKRASAKRITVVMPFYGYARQDKKHRGREPISARMIADMFKVAGADRLICVDLHTDQIQGFFDGPVDHMRAQPLLCGYIADNYSDHDLVVVSPDSGRVRVAEKWADALGGVVVENVEVVPDQLHLQHGFLRGHGLERVRLHADDVELLELLVFFLLNRLGWGRGRGANARARATRCAWPPESAAGARSPYPSSRTRRSISSTRSRAWVPRTPRRARPKRDPRTLGRSSARCSAREGSMPVSSTSRSPRRPGGP